MNLISFGVINSADLQQHVADVWIVQIIPDGRWVVGDFEHHFSVRTREKKWFVVFLATFSSKRTEKRFRIVQSALNDRILHNRLEHRRIRLETLIVIRRQYRFLLLPIAEQEFTLKLSFSKKFLLSSTVELEFNRIFFLQFSTLVHVWETSFLLEFIGLLMKIFVNWISVRTRKQRKVVRRQIFFWAFARLVWEKSIGRTVRRRDSLKRKKSCESTVFLLTARFWSLLNRRSASRTSSSLNPMSFSDWTAFNEEKIRWKKARWSLCSFRLVDSAEIFVFGIVGKTKTVLDDWTRRAEFVRSSRRKLVRRPTDRVELKWVPWRRADRSWTKNEFDFLLASKVWSRLGFVQSDLRLSLSETHFH